MQVDSAALSGKRRDFEQFESYIANRPAQTAEPGKLLVRFRFGYAGSEMIFKGIGREK